jgi:hypothetical protein
MSRIRTFVLWAGALVVLLGVGVAARVAAGGEVPTRQTAVQDSGFNATACPAPSRCVLVGFDGSVAGVDAPFAAFQRGTDAWVVHSPPSPSRGTDAELLDVSCPAPDACMTIGHQTVPAAYLGAADSGGRPLAEAWDGTRWQAPRIPVPTGAVDSGFVGVGCAPPPASLDFCMAVGQFETRKGRGVAFAESWNGTAWTERAVPIPHVADESALAAVTCISPTFCVAVGHYTYEAQIFNGATSLIEIWNGSAWRLERSDDPQASSDTELAGISCALRDWCMAVGYQSLKDGDYATFAERRVGGAWHSMSTPNPPGAHVSKLADVACPANDRCMSVGERGTSTGYVPLAERWDGSRWRIDATHDPSGTTSSTLIGVDCASVSECLAAGAYRPRSLVEAGFVSTWNGAAWSLAANP